MNIATNYWDNFIDMMKSKSSKVEYEERLKGVINKLNNINEQNNKTLSEAYQNKEANRINFNEFRKMKIFERIDFDNSGESFGYCVENSDNKIILVTYSKKGSKVDPHSHDFDEYVMILMGKMKITYLNKEGEIEKENNIKRSKGLKIPKYQIHNTEIGDHTLSIIHIEK